MTTTARSDLMRKVRSKDTAPERAVRSTLHRMGIRFRLHRRDLPGTPDIVLKRFRTAIFVHGYFWHRHSGCPRTTTPKTNRDFWQAKFRANRRRDRRKQKQLAGEGWNVLVIWECETLDVSALEKKLAKELGTRR